MYTFQNLEMLKIRNEHWNYLKCTKLPTHAIKILNTINIKTNLTTHKCYNFKITYNSLEINVFKKKVKKLKPL